MSEAADTPAASRKGPSSALIFVAITVTLDAMAANLAWPVLPQLIRTIGHLDFSATAQVFGVFASLYALLQIFSAPLQGALSDRYGRRPVILTSNFGLGVDYLIMALSPSLWWLFAGRLIAGATTGSISVAYAYVGDVTAPQERAKAFGLLGAALAFGAVAGPALGGLLGTFDLRAPFWAAAAMSTCNGLYGLAVLPELLAKERQTPFKLRNVNPINVVLDLWRVYPRLKIWAVAGITGGIVASGVNNVVVPYTMYRFHWTAGVIGLFLSAVGIGYVIIQGVLTGAIVKRLGLRNALLGGIALTALALAGLGLAPSGWIFCAIFALVCVGSVTGPAQMAIVSSLVAPGDQGRLQGGSRAIGGVANTIGASSFAAILAFALGHHLKDLVGLPFVAGAALMAATGLVIVVATNVRRPAAQGAAAA